MRSFIPILWLILHFLCFIFSFGSFLLFYDEKLHLLSIKLALFISTFLHLMITFLDMKITANIGQSLFSRLILNYSFHVATISFMFFITRIYPFLWFLAIGYSSINQVIRYFAIQITPQIRRYTSLVSCILFLHQHISIAPNVELFLAFFELLTAISVFFTKDNTNRFITSFASSFYLFWYVLYRYSTRKSHQEVWKTISQNFISLASLMPTFIRSLMIKFNDTFAQLGKLGLIFYHARFQNYLTRERNIPI